jgi:hypothetical protein
VRASASGAALKRRFEKWPVYAAVTGAAMATATNASASIIYSGLLDETISVASHLTNNRGYGHEVIPFKNTAGHSIAGFSIGVSHGSYAADKFGDVELYGNGVVNFLLKSNFAKHLSSGAKISGAGFVAGNHGVFDRFVSARLHQTYGWAKTGKTQGFVGFEIESVNGHAKDYGWVKLAFSLNGNGYPDGVTVISWAYQNNGVAIQAGDTGIAPEPSTMALAILAAGAAGVAALRRVRKPGL